MANLTQNPYLLPQQPYLYPSSYRNQFPEQLASTSISSPTPVAPNVSSSNLAQSSFRAPAHKHAHHLHSIPPREKSTRTLIIDHMLWVHGTLKINLGEDITCLYYYHSQNTICPGKSRTWIDR